MKGGALEGHPGDGQKDRLENFLAELMLITRRYRILLLDDHETLELLDLDTQRLIGVGLTSFSSREDPEKITSYVPADSILDGVWLVDTDQGAVEQHTVTNVFPRRAG